MAKIYREPGVYINEIENPRFISPIGGARVVAIVGLGKDYVTVKNEKVAHDSSGGIDTISGVSAGDIIEVLGVGDVAGVYNYTVTTDYAISGNTIDWSPAGDEPEVGATYYVTYTKRKISPDDYDPITYYSIDDVRANYGDALSSGNISEVTIAASQAFRAGASQVVICQAESGSVGDIEAAIDKLKKEEVHILVVVGSSNTTIQAYAKEHCQIMSSPTEKRERVVFLAPSVGTIAGMKSEAESLYEERCIVVVPEKVDVILTDAACESDTTLSLSSIYAGAYLAGKLANPNISIAEPLTRKQVFGITGFSGINYLDSQMNNLASSGITVLKRDGTAIKVRHALTTNTLNRNHSEISVVMIKDSIRRLVRNDLDAAFIGTRITTETPSQVVSRIKALLDSEKGESINSYRNVRASVNSSDPTAIDISFEISVIYPFNYADIEFTLYV